MQYLLCVVAIIFIFEYGVGLGIVEIATKRVGEKLKERVEGVVEGKGVNHLHNHEWKSCE